MEGAIATLWYLKIATGYHREDDEQQYREPKETSIIKIIYYVTAFLCHYSVERGEGRVERVEREENVVLYTATPSQPLNTLHLTLKT